MRILLDTHFLVWLAAGGSNLRPAELTKIQDGDNEILASAASIWELRIKWTKQGRPGRIEATADPMAALTFAEDAGIPVMPLSAADCAVSLEVATQHRDPFDEMLLIHAQRLGARLLTRDRAMSNHPLALQL
ncbi:type II toxin-antitoxin system VapC family toxin [Sphingomonas sp.]|uniref:type II toxin-antitoxin system VapC family toxin n=1 Tax=Sphingomonas sp. TaxID=28214 RepID=UPI002E333C07|nr:type II toxin-antitoxin system VapC family toxin [Sphingomonas sp.]HEX4692935.1 type II toxin-antitoxin system VapC family toxin [Sphingomonas sp.]